MRGMYGWHANKRKQNCLDMDMNVLMMGKQMAHNLGTACAHKDAIMDEAQVHGLIGLAVFGAPDTPADGPAANGPSTAAARADAPGLAE